MRCTRIQEEKQLESTICESDLGFELLDMLAQANIDFRRLPKEELRNLMASFRHHSTAQHPAACLSMA